jgi:hypothetical protein
VPVVAVQEAQQAAELAAAGLPVVVAGVDADAVGRLVARLRADGGRAAGYIGEPGDPGAEEMLAELFPG